MPKKASHKATVFNVRYGGHHGHVFDDGPPPTGKRWRNNGVALRFIPRDTKKS